MTPDLDAWSRVLERLNLLEKIRTAAASVLSEEGVREYLGAYVMGCELTALLDGASEADPETDAFDPYCG